MKIKRLNFHWKKENKSQSLVELALVFMTLLVLFAGMIEFGNLLNQYINIIDGAREGSRFGSTDDPFYVDEKGNKNYDPFFLRIYQIVEGQFDINGNQLTTGAIYPLKLSPANGDDIVITFYSITTQKNSFTHATPFVGSPPTRYGKQDSRFSVKRIEDLIKNDTPNAGLVVVEIFYHYNQILKIFDFSVIDPKDNYPQKYSILLHGYSIMPLSSAEPTATP